MQAGGFNLKEYYARTLLEAFSGLGCFIDEEVSSRNATPLNAAINDVSAKTELATTTGTPGGAKGDDVF